jgi:hypothetical protein
MLTSRRHQPRRPDHLGEILIRSAYPDDLGELARLAALDSQPTLDTQTLIAEIDGVAVAALSLSSGRVIADPFVRTAAVCDLLRVRAGSITPPHSDARRLRRLRLAPAGMR